MGGCVVKAGPGRLHDLHVDGIALDHTEQLAIDIAGFDRLRQRQLPGGMFSKGNALGGLAHGLIMQSQARAGADRRALIQNFSWPP